VFDANKEILITMVFILDNIHNNAGN